MDKGKITLEDAEKIGDNYYFYNDEPIIDDPIKLKKGEIFQKTLEWGNEFSEKLTREELNSIISSMKLKEKLTKRGVTKSPLVKGKAKKNLRKLNKARRKQK